MVLALPLYPWPSLVSGKYVAAPSCIDLIFSSFAEAVLKAAKGESGIVEPSYVYLPGVPGGEEIAKTVGVEFFSVPIELGVSSSLVSEYSNTNS